VRSLLRRTSLLASERQVFASARAPRPLKVRRIFLPSLFDQTHAS
jgi:hypothetical protein